MNLSDIAISNIRSADYCSIVSIFGKREAINLMSDADLIEKLGTLKNIKICCHI